MVAALGSAVAAGWSIALMHHSASRAPRDGTGFGALLRHLAGQRRWQLGMVASLVGLALHAVALRLGSLAVVQPLVVTALVFAFVFRAVLDRRPPSREVVGWAGLTAVGLAVFLLSASSTRTSGTPSQALAVTYVATGVVVALAAGRLSRGRRPARAGLLLGVTGGVLFGLLAGVLKMASGSIGEGTQVLTTWPAYGVLVLGVSGFLVNQHAYSVTPLTSVLPVINVVNPLVAVLFGIVVFAERPGGQPVMVVSEVVGLLAVLAGVGLLARVDDQVPPATAADHRDAMPSASTGEVWRRMRDLNPRG